MRLGNIGNLGSIAGSALNVFGVDMMVRANNIANVNTSGFHSQDVSLMTGTDGYGVRVGAITTNTTPGPYMPGLISISDTGHLAPGFVEGSNTDIATEFVSMINSQRAYEANTVTIRAADDMLGTLLNMTI